MLPDKEIKKQFRRTASENPEQYYAVDVLNEEGFRRGQCSKCGTWFWTVHKDQTTCGDAACQGGFTFLDNPASQEGLSYAQVWNRFSDHFKKYGYTPISRFPVVARWNPTMEYTIASIAAFQPSVVNGEAKPPAEKLVIPQFCLRFGDVDNVGVTMSHLTGFVMIGQHQFVAPKDWDQSKAFKEIFSWLTEGLGLSKEDITFHEDAWAGGGNYGPCMEYFSRGLELGNQVYMMFEQDDSQPDGYRELDLKVLDMGMGHERNAWFSQAAPTIYDATFPFVIDRLVNATGVEFDKEFIRKYVPYGAYLNLDEVDDITEAWKDVAEKMDVSVDTLRQKLEPMTAIYSIAEHARSLLVALADGALPSNVGGGYNLRMILRRALQFIDKYQWNVDLKDVCAWHAQELEDIFPELKEQLDDVNRILDSEKNKYVENRKRNKQIIANELNKGTPDTETLLKLYDSKGVTPEEIDQYAKENDLSRIDIPDNFYSLVSERQQQREQTTQTKRKDTLPVSEDISKTTILYYDDWKTEQFSSKVLEVVREPENKKQYVVLEKTAFYPTSGGQQHDHGTLDDHKVLDCIKQGKHVLHVLEDNEYFKQKKESGEHVTGLINMKRRKLLTQHHTSTHIINGAAKNVLGSHVWQAGAAKSESKARLDITHFDALSQEELQKIEEKANHIIKQEIPITKTVMPRDEAESRYGFRLYQGGAVPGQEIRVVDIPGFDVEACGGTHLNNTAEAEMIRILKSTKVQDGIVRIEFTAGDAAKKEDEKSGDLVSEASKLLDCEEKQLPARAQELFTKWKKAKKKKLSLEDFKLTASETTDGDPLTETAQFLKTQPEHIVKTIKKFKDQLEKFKQKVS
ncbi:MAG: alanine--tRNA ligase [Nanobdellota archaeon]